MDVEDAFFDALERLAAPCKEADRALLWDVGVMLVGFAHEPSALNRRLLQQMAEVRKLPSESTGAEKLARAAMLVTAYAPAIRGQATPRALFTFASRIARETAEPAILAAVANETERQFIVGVFERWVERKPTARQLSTAGVLAELAQHFAPTGLWGVTGQSQDNVRRAIASRIRAGAKR